MRLTWTNSEWDNFSGVASKDNLMMLEAGDDFLNAGGRGGNENIDKYSYTGDDALVTQALKDDNLLPESKLTTSKDLAYVEQKIEQYTQKANDARQKRDAINVTNTGYTLGSKDKKDREKANKTLWGWDKMQERATEIKNNLVLKLEKIQADADAKAKAKAQAEADAKAEAERIAQMKSLNDQLINAKTPEEKKSVQAQIDALAGNVAKGGSKYLTYGIIGLVVVVGAFMLFKRNN
jgi:hypothetical protein